MRILIVAALCGLLSLGAAFGQRRNANDSLFVATTYMKLEFMIPMRDGVRLYTAVYMPRDSSRLYPFLIKRTPYSCAPYGAANYPDNLGPSPIFNREPCIYVYQDVRGRYLSEGVFEDMRPQQPGANATKTQIDESSDTWDTIEWLTKNLRGHNGKAGLYGISYPGFYAAAGVIDGHPALVCASPQAPIADWWFDDFYHHGAFFLPHFFNFFSGFGAPRPVPTTQRSPGFRHPTPDGYDFFLKHLGPLSNIPNYYGDSIRFFNEMRQHPAYDDWWKARSLPQHLQSVHCAVLTVGGWFDAEDLYGPLNIYGAIERQNPGLNNRIVMGPWRHGGWSRGDGTSLGNVHFGNDPAPSAFYQQHIEYPFFMHHLKGYPIQESPEAWVFETGANAWRQFNTWPPRERQMQKLYFGADGALTDAAALRGTALEFISDPAKPVPSHEDITTGMPQTYMTADQRFAARRPDVLVFQSEVLTEDITLAGPLLARLFVSTDQTDADWVVKLIDVYPDDAPAAPHQLSKPMGGYQQMVRSEAMRGRFRNSYSKPEPFKPGKVAEIELPLQDVLHSFKKGHRIMVQVQSSWFPVMDRNPQRYVPNLFEARAEDFVKASHRVFCGGKQASSIEFGVLR